MYELLRNHRIRGVLLNATLVILFASAWVSDRWPELTVPALGAAFAVVIAEVCAGYLTARARKKEVKTQVVVKAIDRIDIGPPTDSLTGEVRRESIRGLLANTLIYTTISILGFGAIAALVLPDLGETIKTLLQIIILPVIGIYGAIIGFYFGHKSKAGERRRNPPFSRQA